MRNIISRFARGEENMGFTSGTSCLQKTGGMRLVLELPFFNKYIMKRLSHDVTQTVLERVTQIVWFTFHLKDAHSQVGYNTPHFS